MDHEIGGASSSMRIYPNVGSSTLVFSSPGPLVRLSASSLDSVDQTCLYYALYKNRARGQGLGASILGQVVAFGSRKKVGFQYQMSLPSEPFCPEPLRRVGIVLGSALQLNCSFHSVHLSLGYCLFHLLSR